MSENEETEKRDKKKAKADLKTSFSKEKKRKRRTTDHSEDKVESKEPQMKREKILDIGIDGVETEPKEPSKRQMKRDKVEQKYIEQREASKLQAAQKACNYISKWKHAKSDWKFEKLRQIWLLENLLDDNLVPDSIFPMVLEYFEGCKGMARQQLVKRMMEVIKKIEEINDTDENDESEATNTAEYQRARQVLQALPTEG